MIRAIWTIMLIGLGLSVHAQTPSIYLMTQDTSFLESHALIQLNSNGGIGSNMLDRSFIQKAAWGGYITKDHIESMLANANEVNRFGFHARGEMEFYAFGDSLLGNKNWGLNLQAATVYHAGLSFSRDLFDVLFKGNTHWKGDTASISPLAGEFQAYQKFGVGFFNKRTFSGVRVSFVSGQDFTRLDLRQSRLYTSPNADTLQLSYTGDYWRADTSKSGWGSGKGLGVALDFRYNLPLADNKGFISVEVNDFGIIKWNDFTEHYAFDSITTFTGIGRYDALDFDVDSLDFPNLQDSLYYERTTGSEVKWLPASFHLRMMRRYGERGFLEGGLSIWPSRFSVPMVYVGATHFIQPHLAVSVRTVFGGWTKVDGGLEVQWMPKNRWLLRLGTNSLVGWVSESYYGQEAHVTLALFLQKRNSSK